MKTHGILEQHHALGIVASYARRQRARAAVGVDATPTPSCRMSCAPTVTATFGTWNHPRRLVGFVT